MTEAEHSIPMPIPAALRDAAGALPSLYADPVLYDILSQMTAPDDLPFYQRMVGAHGSPVLELGCGTGRVLLALAEAGAEAWGVELSPAMLEFARQKAETRQLGVTLGLGDIRSFDLKRTFPLILMPYNILNHLLDVESLQTCLASVRRHMDAETRLVVDTFQPDPVFLADQPEQPRLVLRFVDPYSQQEVHLYEENHYQPTQRLNRIVWRFEFDGSTDARIEEMTMRLYFADELESLLAQSGFAIEARYGDYDGRPFDATTPKQLTLAKKLP
jgi:SAM-dependent methyltransferase